MIHSFKARVFIEDLQRYVHEANKKWWTDLKTGEYPIERNKAEMIALMHSELSEMLEGIRKNLMDDKLPDFKNEDIEAADLLIRLLDYCEGHSINLGLAFLAKMEYNAVREDHTLEHRLTENGKKF